LDRQHPTSNFHRPADIGLARLIIGPGDMMPAEKSASKRREIARRAACQSP
jgi:hypothetical protein